MASDLDFIVVTGTRRWSTKVRDRIAEIRSELGQDWMGLVIEGGADGADEEACEEFARPWTLKAPWDVFKLRLGPRWKCAGNVRNGAIAGAVKVLLDLGFKGRGYAIPDKQSRGTHDCVKRLREVGLEVEVMEA